MTRGVTATHDSGSLRASRWFPSLRRTRLVLGAAAIAPALRPGESMSLGLRVPEVLEAIRQARAIGSSQRAEFFQRVPLDRWYEAIATPIRGSSFKPGLVLLAFHDLTPLRRVE